MAKDSRGRELPKGIRQRDNGTFEGRVAVDGKRVSIYGNTVTEVKKKIAETKYKMEHGIYVDQSNISLDDWFHTWLCIFRKNCASVPEERSAIPLQTEQSSAG